jgi:hypothetical protein
MAKVRKEPVKPVYTFHIELSEEEADGLAHVLGSGVGGEVLEVMKLQSLYEELYREGFAPQMRRSQQKFADSLSFLRKK